MSSRHPRSVARRRTLSRLRALAATGRASSAAPARARLRSSALLARRAALLRRRPAVDGLPAAGARHPLAGHDGHPAVRRHQPVDHRDRQSLRAHHGLRDDALRAGSGGRAGRAGRSRPWSRASPVAAVIGLINGFIIAYLGVSPILATLGTMTLVQGHLDRASPAATCISGFPDPIVFIGNGTVWGVPGRAPRLRRRGDPAGGDAGPHAARARRST